MNMIPRLVPRSLSRKYQLTQVNRILKFITLGIGFCKVWVPFISHVMSYRILKSVEMNDLNIQYYYEEYLSQTQLSYSS